MNKTIVISGIAQGMGREVALLMAKQGYNICGFDMDEKAVEVLQQELDKDGFSHLLMPVNITDAQGLENFRDAVIEKYHAVDTVLSNVGIGFFGPFEELNLDAALTCMNINVIGCARLLQLFIPVMREKKQGRLVVMSSLVGRIPFPFESLYSASKFAVNGMVESLKYEVEAFNIEVALIEPAQVSTTFAAKIHQLPEESSPYYDRVKRFIDRDNELIKTATTPSVAAQRITNVLLAKKMKFFNQVDGMSTVFLMLNKFLPKFLRDKILLNHMNIKA